MLEIAGMSGKSEKERQEKKGDSGKSRENEIRGQRTREEV